MAKIRKIKLSWAPSNSDRVTGYKLYWSKDNTVSYDSKFVALGKVNEAYLPDILEYDPVIEESITIGITSVNECGNESDMTILSEPYRPSVLSAPKELTFAPAEEFNAADTPQQALKDFDKVIEEGIRMDVWKDLAKVAEPLKKSVPPEVKTKEHNKVGFRKID